MADTALPIPRPMGRDEPYELRRARSLSAIDRLLAEARSRIGPRVPPERLAEVQAAGALVVDIRPHEQRQRDGDLPGAVVIDRNVLEWRLDPTSPHKIAEVDGADRVIVLVCNEGYQSSLAADTLRGLGLRHAVDLEGGFQAWLDRASASARRSP